MGAVCWRSTPAVLDLGGRISDAAHKHSGVGTATSLKWRLVVKNRRGFTLIELLVVIAIIALLIGLLLPQLSKARREAKNLLSLGNMRGLNQMIASYTNEYKDALPYFWGGNHSANQPNQGDLLWYQIWDNPVQRNGFYAFSDGANTTTMWAFHWASNLMHWSSPNDLGNKIQFAPGDQAVLDRFQDYRSQGNLDGVMWDGSYAYSPTMWTKAERYVQPLGGALPPIQSGSGLGSGFQWMRANRISDILQPNGKVVLWERFDFSKISRAEANGRTNRFPQWNNPESTARFATADGSAATVRIVDLNEKAASANQGEANVFRPVDTWAMPQTTLNKYDMGRDGFQNGVNNSGGPYPSYFWSTRNGIRGRDVFRN